MNLYLLVEGRQTERKLYPQWINLISLMSKVSRLSEVRDNNFFIVSGEGYPRILCEALTNSLKDIQSTKNFDEFWIVVDSDGCDPNERKQYVFEKISEANINIGNCKVKVFVQNPCLETWGLGNVSMLPVNRLHGEINDCYHHYDVSTKDPELMISPNTYKGTTADYHVNYLKKMVECRNLRYSKNNPFILASQEYFGRIIERAQETGHISSFNDLYNNLNRLPKA